MSQLAIIIPCYNEEKRLHPEKILHFLSANRAVYIFFINDGSTDRTMMILENIKNQLPDRVSIQVNDIKKGKAEAVRTGLLESYKKENFSHHGYLDADLAVSLDEFYRLFDIVSASGQKFIFGSRVKKIGATIIRNEWRHFYSRIIASIVGFIIKLDVYDTQCSAKIFQRELLPAIFTQPFRTKWLFDIEIISRLYRQYGPLNANGTEEPLLTWTEIKGSKLRWFNLFHIAREILILYKYYRTK